MKWLDLDRNTKFDKHQPYKGYRRKHKCKKG